MNIPTLKGTIARRLLVSFHAEPDAVRALLPRPFRPKLHEGQAILGVCLIRLEGIRPDWSPLPLGLVSENAAHRIAVEWDEPDDGSAREGVFIPRRDTGSRLNALAGGRLFPGQHGFATFDVREEGDAIRLEMRSRDGLEVQVEGHVAPALPSNSCFASLEEASAFFRSGSLGYSVRRDSKALDGLTLEPFDWRVEALETSLVRSTFFERSFTPGSIEYDHTLLMRGIEHRWHAAMPLDSRSV